MDEFDFDVVIRPDGSLFFRCTECHLPTVLKGGYEMVKKSFGRLIYTCPCGEENIIEFEYD